MANLKTYDVEVQILLQIHGVTIEACNESDAAAIAEQIEIADVGPLIALRLLIQHDGHQWRDVTIGTPKAVEITEE